MSHSYTPDPANAPASITLPDDNDDFLAAAWNVPIEDVADKLANLDKRGGAGLASPYYHKYESARTYTRIVPGEATEVDASNVLIAWRKIADTGLIGDGSAYLVLVPTNYLIFSDLRLPQGVSWTGGTVRIDPQTSSGPTARVKVMPFKATNGLITQLRASWYEDPNTGASYQAAHAFSFSLDAPETVDHEVSRYGVQLWGEVGGTIADVRVHHVAVTFTQTNVRF